MKLGTVLAALLVLALAAGGVYWIARPVGGGTDSPAVAAHGEDGAEPVPSPTGPHPKAVVPETEYLFGAMRVEETLSHEFVVRNEGAAPLRLGKPKTTCKCTVAKEVGLEGIPPGGQETIRLDWTPKAVQADFSQQATIRTNDPDMPEIHLVVRGEVDALLRVEPTGPWQVGDMTGDEPTEVSGVIYSKIRKSFGVVSVSSDSPLLTGAARPMDEAELKKVSARSGYVLTATVSPDAPVGKFDETLTVKTDLGDEQFSNMTFRVVGTRRGPLQFLPLPGVVWKPEAMAVDLGRFPVSKGASASVMIFVSGLPEGEDLKFTDVQTSDPAVTLELTKDESFAGKDRQKYLLTFRVPPGAPIMTHRSKSAVKVTATTNHPRAETVKFFVELVTTP